MLKSVDSLKEAVSGPLLQSFGSDTRVINLSVYGTEVRGLALCPGRVVRFVFESKSRSLRCEEVLAVKQTRKSTAI